MESKANARALQSLFELTKAQIGIASTWYDPRLARAHPASCLAIDAAPLPYH
jgi:hypothetical protein